MPRLLLSTYIHFIHCRCKSPVQREASGTVPPMGKLNVDYSVT